MLERKLNYIRFKLIKLLNKQIENLATPLQNNQTSKFDLLLPCVYTSVYVRMEKFLDKALEDIINADGVAGCVVSDKQGLCLGSRGTASPESSGLLTAISQYAKKLHPGEPTPTVVLENDEKQCIIQSNDKLVVSIYKNVSS